MRRFFSIHWMGLDFFFWGFVVLFTAVFTYPAWLKLGSGIYADSQPDNIGTAYSFWWLQFSYQNHLPLHKLWISQPFGWDQRFIIGLPLWTGMVRLFGYFTNHLVTYNILMISSFPLTYLTTYILLKILTQNKLSSYLGALLYTFCAYHMARSLIHLSLAHIEWIPLALLSLILIAESPSFKRSVFCALSFTLLGISEFHYIYFMGIVACGFCLLRLAFRNMTRAEIKSYLWALVIFGVFYIGIFYAKEMKVMFWDARENPILQTGLFHRDFKDLFRFSAKPLSYLLPYPQGSFLGPISSFYASSPFFGYSDVNHWEQVVFVGFLTLIFSFYGAHFFKKEHPQYYRVFLFISFFLWISSFSPYWKFERFTIYFPSYFLYKLFPIVRSYGRMSIILELFLVIFATFGIKKLLLNQKKFSRVAISLFVMICVVLGSIHVPPFRFLDLSHVPQVYQWLTEQKGDFIVAEYPLVLNDLNIYKTYYQSIHHKKLLNGCRLGSRSCEVSKLLQDLRGHNVPSYLRGLGVHYVIFHREGISEIKNDITLSPIVGLKFLGSFDDNQSVVYEVIAEPLMVDI